LFNWGLENTVFDGVKASAIGGAAGILGGCKFNRGEIAAEYAYLFNQAFMAQRLTIHYQRLDHWRKGHNSSSRCYV